MPRPAYGFVTYLMKILSLSHLPLGNSCRWAYDHIVCDSINLPGDLEI